MCENNICASLSLSWDSCSLCLELKALLSSSCHKNNSSHQTAHWPPVLPQICTHSSNQCIPQPFTAISSSREQHSTAQQQARHVCWRLHNGSASKHTSLKALGTNTASSGETPGVVAAVFFFLLVCVFVCISQCLLCVYECIAALLHLYVTLSTNHPDDGSQIFINTLCRITQYISLALGKMKMCWASFVFHLLTTCCISVM